jgi:hypothetical protein
MEASMAPSPLAISGHHVGELAAGLDEHGHAAQLGLGELVLGDGLAEHLAVLA